MFTETTVNKPYRQAPKINPPTVFISYSSKDEQEKEELLTHLAALERHHYLKVWSHDRIAAGTNWEQSVKQAIGQAEVAILLITANFLNSDFIIETELPLLQARQVVNELVIIPVIARACAWRNMPWLTHMDVRPKGGQPIWYNGHSRVDESLTAIAEELFHLIPQPPASSTGEAHATPASAGLEAPHSPAKPAPNPFGARGRITDPERFFDRQELMRQIFEELNKGTNLSLVGESQIGKSSILSMIQILGPSRLANPPQRIAYLSLEWVDDEDDFYEALCHSLEIETVRGYKLTRALQESKYLLCLDEIEKMAWDGFTVRVRSHLRGLADGHNSPLTLIIASRSSLGRLFPDSPEMNSPLAGICHQINIGPFAPAIARDFLIHRLQGTGITFTEAQIDRLVAESQGIPARLQQVAAQLYRTLV